MRTRFAVALPALVAWLGVAARPGVAQESDGTPSGLGATRPALEQLLERLQRTEQAPESSVAVRTWALSQAALVRARLSDGDFQAGDRVLLWVEGAEALVERAAPGAPRSVEQELSDTFTVRADRELMLPVVGVVPLRGVLRSELEAHLTREIGRFIRQPVVRARALIRVSVVGAVAKPGFYGVPGDAVLSDALMAAGGPTPDAKLRDLRIERSGKVLWQGTALQRSMTEGRTLDDMNLRAGDQFFVPSGGRGSAYETVRTVGILLTIPITIYTLTRIF